MKYFYLSLLFTAFSFSCFSQDTIYMNKDYKELDTKKNAEFFKIVTTNAKEEDFLRTTYFIDGTKKAEQFYDLKGEKKVYDGLHKHYYESGELFYQLPYNNGKKHGNLVAYWKNGEKRRQDIFKKDKFKEGKVWNKEGEELDYFAYLIPASFPGGQEKLYSFLKENINIPQGQEKGTSVRVILRLTINPEGNLSEIQIVEGAPHRYNAEAVRVLSKMPQWNPTQRFGELVASRYILPIIFQK